MRLFNEIDGADDKSKKNRFEHLAGARLWKTMGMWGCSCFALIASIDLRPKSEVYSEGIDTSNK